MKCCLVVSIPVENLSRRKGLRMNELTSAAWLEPNCKFVFKFGEIFNNCFTAFKSCQQITGNLDYLLGLRTIFAKYIICNFEKRKSQ